MVKPSLASVAEPFLHLVGDGLRRADHGEAGIAAEPLRELAHGEILPLPPSRPPARGRSCWRCSPGFRAAARRDRSAMRRARARSTARRWRCRNRPGCRACARLARASSTRVADDDEAGRHDLHMVARPAGLFHAAFHVGIEFAPGGDVARRREHRLRGFGGELAAGIGGAGLHDHRPALDRPGDVERPAHREIFALVVEHMQLVGIEIKPALDVADEGIVGPGIPQPGDDVVEFAGAAIALAVLHVIGHAEIERRVGDWRW